MAMTLKGTQNISKLQQDATEVFCCIHLSGTKLTCYHHLNSEMYLQNQFHSPSMCYICFKDHREVWLKNYSHPFSAEVLFASLLKQDNYVLRKEKMGLCKQVASPQNKNVARACTAPLQRPITGQLGVNTRLLASS